MKKLRFMARTLGRLKVSTALDYLLRYGEIGLKSGRVRRSMKERLVGNVNLLFRHHGGRCSVKEEEGRLFLSSDFERADDILSRVFGLVSFSPVVATTSQVEDMTRLALDVAKEVMDRGPRFAVRVRRVGEHSYTSMDVARELGSAILSAHPELKVDLTNPDWEVMLEVRGEKSYFIVEVYPGPGGLPLGSQGRVVALVESPEGAMAAWLMMKRGCRVFPVYRDEDTWAKALASWDPEIEGIRITGMKEVGDVVRRTRSMGIVYPWGLEKTEEEGPRPAFYPLVGFTKDELDELRRTTLDSPRMG